MELIHYNLNEENLSHFEKKYGIEKNGLIELICSIKELDDLVNRRKLNKMRWITIGKGVSHITQIAKRIGLDKSSLMGIIPELELFNESLKIRSFGMFMKKYRRIFGLTAKELAKKTNISLGFINSIEASIFFPLPRKADAIANAIGLLGEAREIYFQIYRKERSQRSLTNRHKLLKEKNGVGSLLRQIRISGGWSQLELKKIISVSGLCYVESGKILPKIKVLKKLAKFYNLSKKDLDEMVDLLVSEKESRRKPIKQKFSSKVNVDRRKTTPKPNLFICKNSPREMLRSFRERNGSSQRLLADQLKVHFSQVSFWESGRRAINKKYFVDIAKYLNLSEQEASEFMNI